MYQKRKIRAEKKNNDSQKSFSKVPISWYPGHMAKTRRQIESDIKIVDIVIELLDARIPISSQNPDIAQIISKKKKIVVLNKGDLADDNKNKQWLEYFQKREIPAVITDSSSGRGIDNCIKEIEKIMEEQLLLQANKGRIGRKIRAMVLGIPNVGKSSFRINDKIELLDTPGVLWPKFESQEVALNLAFTGTIKEDILQRTEIAYELIKFLLKNYKKKICQRYGITEEYIDNTLNKEQPENFNIYEIMLEIGRKRGCIISGGNIDEEKTARIILDEFKNGKLGKITLESPKK